MECWDGWKEFKLLFIFIEVAVNALEVWHFNIYLFSLPQLMVTCVQCKVLFNLFTEPSGQNFPMQVLSLDSSGASYFGNSTEINQQLNVGRDPGPVVVDAIDRRAIWYERNLSLINIQSLGMGGTIQVSELGIGKIIFKNQFLIPLHGFKPLLCCVQMLEIKPGKHGGSEVI